MFKWLTELFKSRQRQTPDLKPRKNPPRVIFDEDLGEYVDLDNLSKSDDS